MVDLKRSFSVRHLPAGGEQEGLHVVEKAKGHTLKEIQETEVGEA